MDSSGQSNQTSDQGQDRPGESSSDSGHVAESEDFSIVSSGTSDFSLLETSSGQDKESLQKSKEDQEVREPGTEGMDQNKTEGASGEIGIGTNDRNFADRKVSSSNSTADISILDIPEDDQLNVNDIEEDSCARNKFDFVLGKKSDLETEELISHSRPKELNSHESSELGSSFSIIEDCNMSSSYPSSFDAVIDKSRIKILPPKCSINTELSTSVDENGQKVVKKKSIHGGIVEIAVHDEDWKQDETEKLRSLPDNPDGQESLRHGNRNEKSKLDKSDDKEVVPKVDFDSAGQQSVGDVDADFVTKRQNYTESVNVGDISADTTKGHDKVKEEGKGDDVKGEKSTDNNVHDSMDKMKEEITDPTSGSLVIIGSQKEAIDLIDVADDVKIPQNARSVDETFDKNHTKRDQRALENYKDSNEKSNHSAKQDDFSLISNSEFSEQKISKHFGKSETESDGLSTNSESSCSGSTGSVEIHMEEPIVETSSEDNDGSERSRTSTKEEDEIIVGVNKESFIKINKEDIDHESPDATAAEESQIVISPTDKTEEHQHEGGKEQMMNTDKDLTNKNTDNLNLEKETVVKIPEESNQSMDSSTGGEERKGFIDNTCDDCSFKLRPKITEKSEENSQREITSENKNTVGSESDVKYVSLPSTELKTEASEKIFEKNDRDEDKDGGSKQQEEKQITEDEFVLISVKNTNRSLSSGTMEEGDGTKGEFSKDINNEQLGNDREIPDSQPSELNSPIGEVSVGKDPSTRTHFGNTENDYSVLNTPESDTDRRDSSSSVSSDVKQQTGKESVKDTSTNKGGMADDRSPSVSDVSTSGSESPDVWQPSQGFRMLTKEEEKVSQSFSKKFEMGVTLRYFKNSDKNRSHESEVKKMTIQMESELEYAKWTYVLTRKDKLLKDRCPNTSIDFDISYAELNLVKYDSTDDPLQIEQWCSEVVEKIKQEVGKINICVICCLLESSQRVLSMAETITSDENLDLEIQHNKMDVSLSSNDTASDGTIIVTGQPHDVAMVMIEMDDKMVKLYQLCGSHLVSLTTCRFPIHDVQQEVFIKFEGKMSLQREFPDIILIMQKDVLKLLVQRIYVEKVLNVMLKKWLKFKHMSKVTLKPSEFSLLCRASVKDFIMKNKLDTLGYDYKWKLQPAKGEIVLYTESREDADDFKNTIFSSFKEYIIQLNDVEMDYIRNSDKWTEIFEDVQSQSKGMAEISLHDDHCIVVTGTDDVMEAWEKYGNLTAISKHIRELVQSTEKMVPNKNGTEKQVKKFVQIDGDIIHTIFQLKGQEVTQKCKSNEVHLTSTDIGFEVVGVDESKVKEICDYLLQPRDEVVTTQKQIKKFVEIDGVVMKNILQSKGPEITHKCRDNKVEVTSTDTGFEVVGVDESEVKEICNYLLQLRGEVVTKQKHVKDIKRFVQMSENEVDMICEQKSDVLEAACGKLEVKYVATNLGFEVKGKTEKHVKEFCDILVEMKQQVAMQHPKTTDEVAKQQSENDEQNVEKVLERYEDSAPVLNVVRFFQLDDGAIRFIEKYKMVELKEIMANIEVNLNRSTSEFEVTGSTEIDVQTILERLVNLKSQIETRRVENVSRSMQNRFPKLEQKYKCIVKHYADRDDAIKLLDDSDVDDTAVWHINGVKVSVTAKELDKLVCDVIVRPMNEQVKGTREKLYTTKKFLYQEKHKSEEVQIPAPLYTQDAGKQKHDLTELFNEMLIELNWKDYSIVALPVADFNQWPPVRLTKVMMSSLIDFCKLTKELNIQKVTFFSGEAGVCQKVIQTIQDALSGFKGDNLQIGQIKRPAKLVTDTNNQSEPMTVKDPKPPPLPEKDYPQPKPPTPTLLLKPEIVVVKGMIAQQDVHAIVNTTSPDFDLKNGAVSRSILDDAGKEIQKEIKKTALYVKIGDIVVTRGYKLKCKAVFHGALQGFDKSADRFQQYSVQVLEKFIMNCLQQAHMRNYKTIAFPVLGAGALEFPPDVVATAMIETVDQFRKKISLTKLSEVRIVVFKDEEMYMVFKKMVDGYKQEFIREMAGPPVPETPNAATPMKKEDTEEPLKDEKPPVSPDLPTQGINLDLGPTSLSAALGDITKLTEFECLILLWPQDEINTPSTDKETILKSVGCSSLSQWETGKDSLSDSKVLVTPGGALPQKTIIHVYVDNQDLQKAFELGLKQADELKMLSVVIPVRPTDQLAKDVGKFSSCIYKAITEKCNQLYFTRHVRVCIGGKHLCQPILATLAKLHETTGAVNANIVQTENNGTVTVEITALKDDMDAIVAEIKPEIVNEKQGKVVEINEVKDKTLTKEDIEKISIPQTQFLLNIRAEIDPDIIEAVRQHDQLDVMKNVVEKLSEHVKLEEYGGKWLVQASSFIHIETCYKNIQEFWGKFTKSHLDKYSGAENFADGKTVIKVDISKDLFNALMLLEKKKMLDIIGDVKIHFLESSESLEIDCKDFGDNKEQDLKRIISRFQTNMVMDSVEVPYSKLKEMKRENFVIKLQTEYPDVYIYADIGNEAEASFFVYIISLSHDNIRSVKQGIQREYLKTTTRTGRFTQSQHRDKQLFFHGPESFTRSHSYQERTLKMKHYQTAERLAISIYMADIRNLPVDCIVNAANGHLLHGGGVAAIISDAAGRRFDEECKNYVKIYGQINVGECCVTNAGNLPYKRVIHGVGPQWSQRKPAECSDLLQKTIEQCIQMANAHGMKSVAIPSISAGLYGMPAEICAKCYAVGVMTVSANRTGNWSLQEIHFVDNKPDMVFRVQAAFSEYFENSGTTRQRSVEEQFKSFTTLEQFKNNNSIIDKLLNNKSVSKTETVLKGTPDVNPEPREIPMKPNGAMANSVENVQRNQQPCRFLLNQNPLQYDNTFSDFKLPPSWQITVKMNLIEIQACPNFQVNIFERDFMKLVSESVAFGQDTDWEKRSSLVKSVSANKDLKDKLKQLKVQVPEPAVGTIASFDTVNGVHVQNVFVVFTPRYTENVNSKKFFNDLNGCYIKLFQEASKTPDVEVLFVSFLKTGNAGIKFKEGAEVFLHAVCKFTATMKPNCKLKQINLIVNKHTNAMDCIKLVVQHRFVNKDKLVFIGEKVDKRVISMIGHKTKDADRTQGENLQNGETEHDKATGSEAENCAICLDEIQETDQKILGKCKHKFCKECIEECFKRRPVCPTCGTVYGVVIGNQPKGTMHVNHIPKKHLPGYEKHGCYVITYGFESGIQTAEHHNPGQAYRGTYRTAYLPDNEKGKLVKELLEIAFERKLVFTIGHSRTTGEENVVTWNDIHHKTNVYGGQQGFGYPDPEYLDRVLDELAAKGVTEKDLSDIV